MSESTIQFSFLVPMPNAESCSLAAEAFDALRSDDTTAFAKVDGNIVRAACEGRGKVPSAAALFPLPCRIENHIHDERQVGELAVDLLNGALRHGNAADEVKANIDRDGECLVGFYAEALPSTFGIDFPLRLFSDEAPSCSAAAAAVMALVSRFGLDPVAFEWAITEDSPLDGNGIGGGAFVVSAEGIDAISTNEWMHERLEQLARAAKAKPSMGPA